MSRRAWQLIGSVLVIYLVLFVQLWLMDIHLNTTPSIPLGLYRVTHEPITRGMLVVFCLPAQVAKFGRERGYVEAGTCPDGSKPAVKEVVAVAGDRIDIGQEGLVVNGEVAQSSVNVSQDSRGRPLPSMPFGRYFVSRGEVWVLGRHDVRSWDSRYYGGIPTDSIQSTARKVWTYE